MVTTTHKHKNSNKSRGKAVTSSLSQPVRQETATLTSYSPNGKYLASVSLAVDKHKLWVYDTSSGRAIAEHVVNSGRITSLAWVDSEKGESSKDGEEESEELQSRKKRKKSRQSAELSQNFAEEIAVGLSNGSVFLFSPTRSEVIISISHSSSTSPILAIASSTNVPNILWTSGSDGLIRAWNMQSSAILRQWKTTDRVPFTSLALRPGRSERVVHLLGGHHTICLLSLSIPLTNSLNTPETQDPEVIASFTGHASPIITLLWDHAARGQPTRFISAAEDDRIAHLWEVPSADGSSEGRIVASLPVDADIKQITLRRVEEETLAAAVSSSGVVTLYSLPSSIPPPSSNKKSNPILTLSPKSTLFIRITGTKEADSSESHIIAAELVSSDAGRINIVRLVGQRPIFESISYFDDNERFLPEVKIIRKSGKGGLDGSNLSEATIVPTTRYSEGSATVASAAVINATDDDTVLPGELDVELAELSLGERLRAKEQTSAHGVTIQPRTEQSRPSRVAPVPAVTLTRTLTQALNSSDAKLLETCFAQSNPEIIKETLRKLPPHFSLPLMNALVERLGRGARAGTGKGGGGGASAQRGTTLIVWIRMLLLIHTAHFMTIPDLVSRLSTLHATLASRATLHEKLLALNGRLDLALSQIDLRKVAGPTSSLSRTASAMVDRRLNATHYVEGESSDEEATAARENESDVEIEEGGDDASVEDVELGDRSDDEAEDQISSGDNDDDEEGESDDRDLNGFIDDEAEEEYDEDESSESEEE